MLLPPLSAKFRQKSSKVREIYILWKYISIYSKFCHVQQVRNTALKLHSGQYVAQHCCHTKLHAPSQSGRPSLARPVYLQSGPVGKLVLGNHSSYLRYDILKSKLSKNCEVRTLFLSICFSRIYWG